MSALRDGHDFDDEKKELIICKEFAVKNTKEGQYIARKEEKFL